MEENISLIYLRERFITQEQLVEASGISVNNIELLQSLDALPKASYEVSTGPSVRNYIWGAFPLIPETQILKFYPRCFSVVLKNLENLRRLWGDSQVAAKAKEQFEREMRTALLSSDFIHYQEKSILLEDGSFNETNFRSYFENTWLHWIHGTYGICAVNPIGGSEIVLKQLAVLRLKKVTENSKNILTNEDLQSALKLFDTHVMPFAPHEFDLSSRFKYYVRDGFSL